MPLAAKIAYAASALVVAGLVALAAPAIATATGIVETAVAAVAAAGADEAAVETVVASKTDTPGDLPDGYVDLGQGLSVPAGGPGDCTTTSWLNIMKQEGQPSHVTLLGPDLVDMGPSAFAEGTVSRDDEGRITTYTVAPGDVPAAIGDRFCLGNGIALSEINHTHAIHPGDVLILTPDPDVAWIPFYGPTDAPAGFQQIPYQTAMAAMGDAAAAGDVDELRSIWTDQLAPVTTDQSDLDAVAEALDDGNLTVLRQMFP